MRTYSTRKRILVTGGAGFLGSHHLCERLLAEGNDVLCADNFFTGTKDNIAHLLPKPIIIYGDGAHSVTVEDIFRGGYTAAKTLSPVR